MTAHLTLGHTKGDTTWSMNVTEGEATYFVVFPTASASTPATDSPDTRRIRGSRMISGAAFLFTGR